MSRPRPNPEIDVCLCCELFFCPEELTDKGLCHECDEVFGDDENIVRAFQQGFFNRESDQAVRFARLPSGQRVIAPKGGSS